ncbi:MAG: GDP-4-dehydro-6-deoxy-D-mannose reductase [Verrucomicrobiales bacterium]|jgi:GDP-4-dehydro-6-deoxy-D-mannose reductase
MRALIIGASGFVGRALHAHLLAADDEVIAPVRADGGPDITDRDGLSQFVAASAPDVVYHLAAQSHVPSSWTDPIGTLRVNVEGTQNVLDAARAAGDARVIVVSSAEVYGSVTADELPIDEDAPFRPINPYAASKVAADAIALQSHLGYGQDVIRLRSFNHFGPGQSTRFVCAGLAERIARAERSGASHIEVGALDVRRDFSDVRDVVRAYRCVAEHGATGQAYNICSGVDRSIREIADALRALSTRAVEYELASELQRSVDAPIVRGTSERVNRDTGWKPEIPIDVSLADILNDARGRLND